MEKSVTTFRSSTWRWLLGSLAGWGTLLLCLIGVGLVIVVWRWLTNIAVGYELTDQRLIIRRGILNKTTDEIELYRIKDTTIAYSVINQLTDIGTITIRSSDATTSGGDLVLPDIPQGRAIREEIRRLTDAARQLRRVREVDVDVEN
ncbi:MAG: PH domain-containing protein [Sphingomonas sp.]|uniref:PH domain-containing protein n=1 Tax=Sphingomonas sp. TaxID=28214 RepID=UPI0025CBFDAA|nr:PH domain-containing protein [Sphingomonas sp.]MBY0284929.1 PH domain-containing protein [Sphingomonas sp.]